MRTFPIAAAALVGAGALMLAQVTALPTEDKTTPPAEESARPDPADNNAQAPAPDNGTVLDNAADDMPDDDEPANSTDDAPPNMM